MTTAQSTPAPGRVLRGPLSSAGLAGLVLVVTAALVAGSPGAAGAAIGAAMVCVVFAFGAVVLGVVAMVAPAAFMLVAFLTYTLQVVLVGVGYLALRSGNALEGPVDARWLSGAVIACTLAWTIAQIAGFTRARVPVYELGSGGREPSVR